MSLTIRDAAPQDEGQWRDLWAQYLAFYEVDLAPEITARTWARLMEAQSPLSGRFAFENNVMQGFALHHHHCSTWVMGEDCYLEDLFVSAAARGKGVGRALLDDLKTIATDRGYHRLYWHTDEGNTRARALYDSYAPYDGHVRYRLKLR